MAQVSSEPILTAVFVDYDNIYLSLKKRNEEAAKRFAKDAALWIKEIESGRMLTPTNAPAIERPRRIVLNRCYGNPVPRRNSHDNSTDMNSFPFVRHHFLRAGFEIIDCPPLTAQLKNSSDIKMVMDVRDFLTHDTRFEEFIILSGDADFTPVLHRLRAHARHTVIFSNDFTAAPYRAIADAEIKESHLLSAILEPSQLGDSAAPEISISAKPANKLSADRPSASEERPPVDRIRAEIIAAVVTSVRRAGGPVPLEALAERTTRALGHDRTVGTSWAGAGSFLELLRRGLPDDIRLTGEPPYLAYEASRSIGRAPQPRQLESREPPKVPPVLERSAEGAEAEASSGLPLGPLSRSKQEAPPAAMLATLRAAAGLSQNAPPRQAPSQDLSHTQPQTASVGSGIPIPAPQTAIAASAPQPRQPSESATAIQQSIARIHDACQAPPLSPPEYRALFEILANEINENGLQGSQTLSNISARAEELGISLKRDDVKFIMEVVSEADPWFEQGASANLFAGRFRNFVVARCRSQGLSLSSEELDLIEAWFAGANQGLPPQTSRAQSAAAADTSWETDSGRGPATEDAPSEEFPKILRTRLRG